MSVYVDKTRRPPPTAMGLGVHAPELPGPARKLVGGQTCGECYAEERCRQDGLCWLAERAAIAEEREARLTASVPASEAPAAAPAQETPANNQEAPPAEIVEDEPEADQEQASVQVLWTEDRIIGCIQAWVLAEGRPPSAQEWHSTTPARPSTSTVRHRFGTWNAAIEAAGFEAVEQSRPRDPWTRERIIAEVQRWAADHEGHPPISDDWVRARDGYPTASTVRAMVGSWSKAIELAGFDAPAPGGGTVARPADPETTAAWRAANGRGRWSTRPWSQDQVIEAIRRWAVEHDGDPPTVDGWRRKAEDWCPTSSSVVRLFGSWAGAMEAAGFEPRNVGRPSTREPRRRRTVATWVKVPGTGLSYRSPDEAYVAAEEVEQDGERVADDLRFDGNDARAEQAVDRSRDLAERIRIAARSFERAEGGPGAGRGVHPGSPGRGGMPGHGEGEPDGADGVSPDAEAAGHSAAPVGAAATASSPSPRVDAAERLRAAAERLDEAEDEYEFALREYEAAVQAVVECR